MSFHSIASGFYLEGMFITDTAAWYTDVTQEGLRRVALEGGEPAAWPGKPLIGGIIANHDGIIINSGPGGLYWLDPKDGAAGNLLTDFEGTPLPGANEFAVDGAGALYFGSIDHPAIVAGTQPNPSSLFRLAPHGVCQKLAGGLTFSNAIGFSPDGKRFYHNETFNGTFGYDVASDGTLHNPVKLLDKPDCDGMAIDVEGGVWVTGYESPFILRMLPNGAVDRQLDLPGGASSTNLCFAGEDMRDLYITAVRPDAAEGLKHGIMPSTPHLLPSARPGGDPGPSSPPRPVPSPLGRRRTKNDLVSVTSTITRSRPLACAAG